MDLSGPDAIDKAIDAGVDLDGSPLPDAMLSLYREVSPRQESSKVCSIRTAVLNFVCQSLCAIG